MRALLATLAIALPVQLPPVVPPLPPPPPAPCLPVLDPMCPPLPEPPPGDDPPVFRSLKIVERTRTTLVLSWRASDDVGLVYVIFYRDGTMLAARSASEPHRWTFRLLCGRHSYRVDVLDLYAQRDSRRLIVRRSC